MKRASKILEPKQRKAFRAKYLAAILAVAALLISSIVSGQLDSSKYSRINGYGFVYKRMGFDSVLMIPRSTSPHIPWRAGAIRYHATDSTLQLWTGNQWNSILTGIGNGIDTAYALNDSVLAIETPNEDFFITIRGTGSALDTLKNSGTAYRLVLIPDSIRSIRFAGTWIFGDTSSNRQELRIGVDPQVGWGLSITPVTDSIYVDTGTNKVATQYYARSQITGVPATRSSYATDKLYQGQAYVYNWSDSAFYPDIIPKFKLSIQKGTGLITFGNSIASPSTNPPTDSMHSTILARNIGGPDSNFAVGGTNIHDALARINQEGKLPRDRTQAMLWQAGIDCREDTSVYADKAVIYGARVAAARAFYRDTLVLTSGMTFSGTWSNYSAGLAAGSISNGRYTTTSGDYFEFAANGRNAFFTFFSESPVDNATNFTDSVQVNVDGVYYGSYDMSNIGIAAGGKYLCAILIQNMSDAGHNIRVFNRRSDTMAIDFAGSLKNPIDCYPVMCELLLPVGSGYIGGSGAIKKLRFNRLNNEYTKDVYYQWQKFGYPIITVDPRNGLDMNIAAHTIDYLHPTSAGQGIMFKSIWPQINVFSVPSALPQWYTTGNSGTSDGTNFIGTTDNVRLTFKVNNTRRMRLGTNDEIEFSQYASATGLAAVAMGASTASGVFSTALNRSIASNQDAFAAGGPGCEANGLLSFATGIGKANGQRTFALINGVADGDGGGALGYGAYSGSFFHVDVGYGSDTTGSYLWSKNTMVSTDPIFTVGAARATDGLGGIVGRRTALRINKSGIGLVDTAWFYNPGKVGVTTTAADSNMLAAIKHVKSLIHDSLATIGAGITSINSQSQTTQTIAGGTAIIVNSSSGTHTISVDNTSDVFLRTLQTFSTDVNNSGTSETDLYSHTIAGNTLTATGQTINFEYAGNFNDATATAELAFSFGGTEFGSTGALTISTTGSWSARGYVMRTGTTTGRAYVTVSMPGAATTSYTNELDLTSQDFTTTNILKVTGQSGGGGGGSNDITAKTGKIRYEP